MSNQTILHILPQDGIGGAELAAHNAAQQDKSIHLLFLVSGQFDNNSPANQITRVAAWVFFSISAMRSVLWVFDRLQPQIVVFSLWKSLPVMLVLRVFRPRLNSVLLLHAARHTHFLDYFFTAIMMRLAHGIWADSQGSVQRVPPALRPQVRVISFLLRDTKGPVKTRSKPCFIFWGRLAPVKNILAALELFEAITNSHPDAEFTVIGPDDGELARLQAWVCQKNLQDQVRFVGQKTWREIAGLAAQHSYYLQLSHIEGMAMSVAEAMQMGLVPVVTAVGEIANYCQHMQNAVLYKNRPQATADIHRLLQDDETFARLSQAAQKTWAGQKPYAKDFADACRDQINAQKKDGE